MIIGFPAPMLQAMVVMRYVPKGEPTQYAHVTGSPTGWVFTSPIDLQPGDQVLIDLRTSRLQKVERGRIAIWRTGWEN